MRGARPGKPGRQTAAASRRTPHVRARDKRRMVQITPSKFAGHSMLCPYGGKAKAREAQ
jgi:hypothetical protein